jgi:hypothetical protein
MNPCFIFALPAGNSRAASHEPAQRCALTDINDQLQGTLAVTKFEQTGISGDAQRSAYLDRVQTQVVDGTVEAGDGRPGR